MKQLLIIFLITGSFSFAGCKKDQRQPAISACGVEDPINNLEWLNAQFKQLAGGPKTNGIILYNYQGDEIIEVQSGVFSSTNQHAYYCNGTKVNLDDPDAFMKFRQDREEIAVLYGTNIW